ncbi:site-specific DNA-methyltransferase [Bacillus safensis]|nr:site-specific DNA-methyltransferase [Bacillus safensis]
MIGELELNRIYQRDCIEGMRMLPDRSVDMILCDLPYGTTRNKWDAIIPFEPLWEQYKRIIKDNGAIVLTAMQPFSSMLGSSNIKWLRYEWVWDKKLGSGSLNAKKQPLRRHENILVFYKKAPTYNPQMRKGKFRNKSTSKPQSNKGNYGNIEHKRDNFNDQYYPTSILEEFSNANVRNRLHPTQKHLGLFEYLIKIYTNKGDTVLDNCMGSGTTAVAAKQLNRNFIGFEINPEYVEISNKRLADANWGSSLKEEVND